MKDAPLYLRPRVDPPLASLLGNAPLLHSLADALGSPLNVLLPEAVAANAERFRSVLRRHHLAGRVYFAHKANRSSALVRRLAARDPAAVGIDVASPVRTAGRTRWSWTVPWTSLSRRPRCTTSPPPSWRAPTEPSPPCSAPAARWSTATTSPPEESPCADLTAHVGRRRVERTGAPGHEDEDWESWWRTAAADPELTDLFEQREKTRPASGDGNQHLSVARHTELLHRAGFRHVTPVWQAGNSRVLVLLKG